MSCTRWRSVLRDNDHLVDNLVINFDMSGRGATADADV